MSISREPKRRRGHPVAILVDRSRDLLAGVSFVRLEPDDRYETTDSRVPLTAARLRRYDMLAIVAQAAMTYSRRETDAIVQFVRRGGGLLLSGSAGAFDRFTGKGVEEMAVAAIARRFGVEFVAPADATGRTDLDGNLVRGYPAGSIALGRSAPMRGLRKEDVFLEQWSPLRASRRATVLLCHRGTGEAAALSVQFGAGKVVAVGGSFSSEGGGRLHRALIDHLASKRAGRGGPERLPCEVFPKYATRRAGNVEIRYASSVARRVPAVTRMARKLLPRFEAAAPTDEPRSWRIELNGSCRSGIDWSWHSSGPVIHLGVGAPDAELAFALGRQVGDLIAWHGQAGRVLRETFLGREALGRFSGLLAMRWAGFAQESERLGEALERQSRLRSKGLDPGRYYGEGDDAPGLWIWLALARRYGWDILERFFGAIPKKLNRAAAPEAVFTELDRTIHFLSQAVKEDLYPWFSEMPATVHPLPRERFGSAAFQRGVRRYLVRLLKDTDAPASERADALEALIAREQADKRPPGHAVRQLRSCDAAVRLVGASRLGQARDCRGLSELEALAGRRDDAALAAIAALRLVEHSGGKGAARLAALATKLDHRFQLEAGYQLGRVGDARAERLSLAGIGRADGAKAARLETRYPGFVEVYPTVDGRHVANIFSDDVTAHMPCNTHVSMFWVYWVHTARKFRRRGLSRLAMARSLNDARARRCSCAALGTGTRNTAHAMYRSFGFVDDRQSEELSCELGRLPPAAPVRGIRVRAYRGGDERAMADLSNACYGESFAAAPARARRPAGGATVMLAYRGGRLVGTVAAQTRGKDTSISAMAVRSDKKADDVARALIGKLHRLLVKRGLKRVRVWRGTEVLAPLLQPMGYRTRKTGGVTMFALLNLPQFLEEIAPLLTRRLGKKDFTGTISILGRKHRAALKIDSGRVSVLRQPPNGADITLKASDDNVTRIVAGIETPFEAYLQQNMQIAPMLNENVRDLLETLFPRLQGFGWLR